MLENTISQKLKSALTQEEGCGFTEWSGDASCIVQYIQSTLHTAFADTGIRVGVKVLPYYSGNKIPIVIALDRQEPWMLWCYEGMSAPEVHDELLGLFADFPLLAGE